MTNQELQDLIIKTFDGIILDEYDREIHRIEGKSYDITFDRSRVEWSCSCPAFRFRRRHKISKCKHIIEIQNRKFKTLAEGRAGVRVV
tara:strand:- start:132 stop:395 length:264 start_codon:yes stop_codon:yes gene_type:complete